MKSASSRTSRWRRTAPPRSSSSSRAREDYYYYHCPALPQHRAVRQGRRAHRAVDPAARPDAARRPRSQPPARCSPTRRTPRRRSISCAAPGAQLRPSQRRARREPNLPIAPRPGAHLPRDARCAPRWPLPNNLARLRGHRARLAAPHEPERRQPAPQPARRGSRGPICPDLPKLVVDDLHFADSSAASARWRSTGSCCSRSSTNCLKLKPELLNQTQLRQRLPDQAAARARRRLAARSARNAQALSRPALDVRANGSRRPTTRSRPTSSTTACVRPRQRRLRQERFLEYLKLPRPGGYMKPRVHRTRPPVAGDCPAT